ncbi:hypothetical protein K435DRAFT_859175 [Dendrothele bispora CBS 962.96]|uniref:Uncharacterized protein n=1 Tax=Dendrothele bispora (strain CBS 962.96) TaxID=1314807 RepID=A0A4S8M174_DENBC|nr:hypothetical protein K435DRAFT_859175 [Dendrothele bispora CBS 962.96]
MSLKPGTLIPTAILQQAQQPTSQIIRFIRSPTLPLWPSPHVLLFLLIPMVVHVVVAFVHLVTIVHFIVDVPSMSLLAEDLCNSSCKVHIVAVDMRSESNHGLLHFRLESDVVGVLSSKPVSTEWANSLNCIP